MVELGWYGSGDQLPGNLLNFKFKKKSEPKVVFLTVLSCWCRWNSRIEKAKLEDEFENLIAVQKFGLDEEVNSAADVSNTQRLFEKHPRSHPNEYAYNIM